MDGMEEDEVCDDDFIEEVEFVAAIKQLQKVHRSRVVELQSLYDEQVHLNVQVREEVEQLREKVKKLKQVASASKIKIGQQAHIIAEQSILLRKARSPSAFQLSELFRDSEQDQLADSEQTVLPSPPTKLPSPTKTKVKSDTSTKPPVHRHMIYSHARNNLDKTNGTNESMKRNKPLSLKGEEGTRVRYKERGSGNKSTANQNPNNKNGVVSDPEDAGTDSGGDSTAGSPSFLTDPSNLNTSWECAGTRNHPMEVDEPMSCSMFHTYVQTSTCEAKDLMSISMSTLKKKRKLDEIAERLNSSKKAKKQLSLQKSWTDPNILPRTPEIRTKASSPNIVPITPGVKSVGMIFNGRKTAETGKSGSVKSNKVCRVELKAASDENKVTSASDIPKDSVRKSKRLAGGSGTRSTILEGNEAAIKVAKRMGLPTDYKCETKILKKADRDKLDAKACPDCEKWYEGNQPAHLKRTCRHKHLHLPPDSDSRMWDISFPNTEDYEN